MKNADIVVICLTSGSIAKGFYLFNCSSLSSVQSVKDFSPLYLRNNLFGKARHHQTIKNKLTGYLSLYALTSGCINAHCLYPDDTVYSVELAPIDKINSSTERSTRPSINSD
jgi:hypothetical protein